MKKNSFLQGAIIASGTIILIKVIGALYVIPFFPLIGEKGGALYGYAYSIYSMVLNLSIAGLPLTISRLTSEYSSLGYHYLKEKAYKMGRNIICLFGIIGFIILFVFSKDIAYLIIRDIKGGNTIEDVTFVIRIISTALLIVPLFSAKKGYLQGQKYISLSSAGFLIEQVVRVAFLLISSYLIIRVFNLGLKLGVGFAVFAATVGSLVGYIYVSIKYKKEKKEKYEIKEEELKVSNKEIIKNIIVFSVVFILIDLIKSGFSFVDLITVNKTLVGLGYSMTDSEAVMSVFTTWGAKLTSVVYAVSSGIMISLIPNITSSFVLNNYEDVKDKISKSFSSMIFVTLPMCFGIALLANPIWVTLFGNTSTLGPTVLEYYIFLSLFISLFSVSVTILHSLKHSVAVIFSMLIGLFIKIGLNVYLTNLFASLGLHAYYGPTTASILGFFVSFLINMHFIKKYVKIDLKKLIIQTIKISAITCIMVLFIVILKKFIVVDNLSRLKSLLVLIVYIITSAVLYFGMAYKFKIVDDIFGKGFLNKIFKRSK